MTGAEKENNLLQRGMKLLSAVMERNLDYMDVYIYQNSLNCALKVGAYYYM